MKNHKTTILALSALLGAFSLCTTSKAISLSPFPTHLNGAGTANAYLKAAGACHVAANLAILAKRFSFFKGLAEMLSRSSIGTGVALKGYVNSPFAVGAGAELLANMVSSACTVWFQSAALFGTTMVVKDAILADAQQNQQQDGQ